MNKLKDTLIFFITCFIACFIVKYVFAKFVFDKSLLIDSLIISTAASVGWYLGNFIKINKKK